MWSTASMRNPIGIIPNTLRPILCCLGIHFGKWVYKSENCFRQDMECNTRSVELSGVWRALIT